jgi:hypothetical protein
MPAWTKWVVPTCLSWILWMDQTVYSLPDTRHQPQAPIAAEGATSKWVQLAVLPTKTACEKLRKDKAQQAAQAQQAARARQTKQPQQQPVYPDAQRFFCSPVE